MNEDEVARDIHRKIEREKALITAANAMRQSTNNPAVVSGLDTKIRDGRRNIEYLESRLNELEMKRVNANMEGMHIDPANSGYGHQAGGAGYPNQYGNPNDFGQQRNAGMQPPNPQFAQPGPASRARAPKPNYSKLGKPDPTTPRHEIAHKIHRSHQVGHPTSRTSNSTHVVTTRIQTQCREAIQRWH
jgi:hypothetical protein